MTRKFLLASGFAALAALPTTTYAAVITLDNAVAGPIPTSNGLLTQTIDDFTVGNHTDRLLVVTIGGEYSGTGTASVMYGTQPMTKAADAINSGGTAAALWYLFAPNVGTADISASLVTGSNGWTVGAASFYNVQQTAPTDVKTSNATATSSNLSVNIDTADGLIVEAAASNNLASPGFAAGSGQTTFYNVNTTSSGGWSGIGSYDFAFAGSPSSQQWTIPSSQRLAHVAASFAPVPEPVALAPLLIAGMGLLSRRRKWSMRA